MSKIVECVPNFSEGKRKEVIDAILEAIKGTEGCTLLDFDPGASTNRTVYTFVGSPEAVVEGAVNAAKVAYKLIDMTKHTGEHPRIGAMDVCPFVPVKGVSMEDCVNCARTCAEKLATILNVPSFLYGAASSLDYRKSIPQIRAGEYESLEEKLKKEEWKPDFGPIKFQASWGATLVGARNFLVAYNINLLATKEQAHRIALDIREQGRGVNQRGKFKCVQAIGWYLDEANMAQVSINITDTEVTAIHLVYEEVLSIAKELELPVVGSQIVGMVPLKALMDCAKYYIQKEKLFIVEEEQKIKLAVDRLGLHSLGYFNPKERVIEYMIAKESDCPLLSLSVKRYVQTVAARTPTPGGGCVAALVASLGAALSTMAGFLTYGNKKFESHDALMRKLLTLLHEKYNELMNVVEADAVAFNDYMAAVKLSKETEEELQIRSNKLHEALTSAVRVPLDLVHSINQAWPTLKELANVVNPNCISDMQVGVRCLETGVWGGHYNVMANLKNFKNKEKAEEYKKISDTEVEVAIANAAEVLKILDDRYWKE
ncbi:hypothetical protein HELRODRAFT_186115 [Helobdella robusta]|uniref:Formimidoyltransferase-cyclodeaminase n=1 Tax=Helobdella robusta TaxID=6412 RepID=T1FNP0_HELRO|nr:hypothetical protein HELRODRAFT_186115 [Helobdella robusta]ESN93307.1 hypothetical protein HELRODRAFT_186115 [Helobdella robusta]